jgi:hypothetical protein
LRNAGADLVLAYADAQTSNAEWATASMDGDHLDDIIIVISTSYSREPLCRRHKFPFALPMLPFEGTIDTLDWYELSNYRYVFFPISDFGIWLVGASHWNLFYVDHTSDLEFKHFDSSDHRNFDSAQ